MDFRCPDCGATTRLELPARAGQPAACGSCRAVIQLAAPASAADPLTVCAVCGDDKLYVQKDFNQKAGCLIVALGAALVPWTYGLSLALCALIDWILYMRLPPLTVCYVCGSRYAGPPLHPDHAPFELMTAQTWEARSLTWRRRRAAAPPPPPDSVSR